MQRPGLREYESAVAASPTRHAMINRPLAVLRRRTETLLDQITGANQAQQVREDQRQVRERDRANRCRTCRMIFSDESALARHYNLFPRHTIAPERRARPPHASRNETSSSRPRRNRTQSTPGLLEERSTHSSGHEIASSRPKPARKEKEAIPPNLQADFMPRAGPSEPAHDPLLDVPEYHFDPAPRYHQRSKTMDVLPSDEKFSEEPEEYGDLKGTKDARGYLHQGVEMDEPEDYEDYKDRKVGEEYFDRTSMVSQPYPDEPAPSYYIGDDLEPRHFGTHTDGLQGKGKDRSMPVADKPPQLALPSIGTDLGFAESFNNFAQDKGEENYPPLSRTAMKARARTLDPIEDLNQAAGPSSRPMQNVRRGRPERAMRRERSDGAMQAMFVPSNFSDVIRAVKATSATGNAGSAVIPFSVDRVMHSALFNETTEQRNDQPAQRSRGEWSAIFDGLPGSTQAARKRAASSAAQLQEIRPVATGLTSFSPDENESPSASPVTSRFTRARSNTSLFMNSNFMRSFGNLKTPPLSPSSPMDSPRTVFRSPSANAFTQLPGDEDAVELWYDAPEVKTPRDVRSAGGDASPTQSRPSFTMPFSARRTPKRGMSTPLKRAESPLQAPFTDSSLPYFE